VLFIAAVSLLSMGRRSFSISLSVSIRNFIWLSKLEIRLKKKKINIHIVAYKSFSPRANRKRLTSSRACLILLYPPCFFASETPHIHFPNAKGSETCS
jgi:hypothetical protein